MIRISILFCFILALLLQQQQQINSLPTETIILEGEKVTLANANVTSSPNGDLPAINVIIAPNKNGTLGVVDVGQNVTVRPDRNGANEMLKISSLIWLPIIISGSLSLFSIHKCTEIQ